MITQYILLMASLFQFSSLISVKDFKQKIALAVDDEDTSLERSVMDTLKLSSEMDTTQETLTELKDVCSPSNLKFKDVLTDDMDVTSKSAHFAKADLASLNAVSEKTSENSDSKAKMFGIRNRNYMVLSEQLRDAKTDNNKIDGPEVILSVALYHPVKLTKVQEFLVLGKQTLAELRDKIYCPADSIVVGEHSENPEFTTVTTAKDICPSGFIFIEGVFYNDTRNDLCRDYSKLIMDWANKKHHGRLPRFGVCTSKKMEGTKFEDLTIKLGYPYVYIHQGNCEHLLIFRDLRMLHTDDPQSLSNYPFHIFRPRPKRQICMICSIYSARWLTRGDLLMSEDPSLFCEKCFKSLHYNKNQKAYAFRAYQYSGDYYW